MAKTSTEQYYLEASEPLLRDLDKTAELVRSFVADRYGEEGTDALYRDVRTKYEEIIPEIPRIAGVRSRLLNTFLRFTAQEVAVYKAVHERGGTPSEAWEICHEAIRLRMARFPNWKRSLFRRFMFSGLVKRIVSRREAKNEQLRLGDFEIRYLTGDGTSFDIGVDYVGCGCLELASRKPRSCLSFRPVPRQEGHPRSRVESRSNPCARSHGAHRSIPSSNPIRARQPNKLRAFSIDQLASDAVKNSRMCGASLPIDAVGDRRAMSLVRILKNTRGRPTHCWCPTSSWYPPMNSLHVGGGSGAPLKASPSAAGCVASMMSRSVMSSI